MPDFLTIARSANKDYAERERQHRMVLDQQRRRKKERARAALDIFHNKVLPQLESAATALGDTDLVGKWDSFFDVDAARSQKPFVTFYCAIPAPSTVKSPSMFIECDGHVLKIGLGEAAFDIRPKITVAEISLSQEEAEIDAKLDEALQRGFEYQLKTLYESLSAAWPRE